MTTSEVLTALADEISIAAKPLRCRIESVGTHANRVELCLAGEHFSLNEHWEESLAWWGHGLSASVAAILPERSSALLWNCLVTPPKVGDFVTFYPPNFLEQLRSFWEHPGRASCALQILTGMATQSATTTLPLPKNHFPELRQAQAASMQLVHHKIGYIWGPPGTGKTFTLGALVSNILLNNPRARILLVAATNQAVDEALLSVDERLRSCTGLRAKAAADLRSRLRRYGSRFQASRYEQANKQHLLVDAGKHHILSELAQHEGSCPEPSNAAAYLRWKERRDALRAQIPRPVVNGPLLAITATAALYVMDALEKRPYDGVVFDEASQLSMPHACAIGTLGKQIVFAGDDKQLAPIVQSKQPATQSTLGRSPFSYKDKHACFLLNEQNRMASEICNVVADMSYAGKLRIAEQYDNDSVWKAERRVANLNEVGRDRISVKLCKSSANKVTYCGLFGPLRSESAEYAISLAWQSQQEEGKDIAILTPFRVQRLRLQHLAKQRGLRNVHISTVHSAQGGEFHTVIFDPVLGEAYKAGGVLFQDEKEAPRLVNVALSRAKARFVVILSRWDLSNPALRALANAIELEHGCGDREPPALTSLALQTGFPDRYDGALVRYRGALCKVERHQRDNCFDLVHRGGHLQTFTLHAFRNSLSTT